MLNTGGVSMTVRHSRTATFNISVVYGVMTYDMICDWGYHSTDNLLNWFLFYSFVIELLLFHADKIKYIMVH